MTVHLIGMGCGNLYSVAARELLIQADVILGSPRLLDELSAEYGKTRIAAVKAEDIFHALSERKWICPCVVYGGDTGFHSGAASLLRLLTVHGISYDITPGVSSVQLLAARLGRAWQDWTLISAHGVPCDPVAVVLRGGPVCFLTDTRSDPAALCHALTAAGLDDLPVTVGENLGLSGERVTHTTAREASERTFAPLSLLLTEAVPIYPIRTPGIPDDAFIRNNSIPKPGNDETSAVESVSGDKFTVKSVSGDKAAMRSMDRSAVRPVPMTKQLIRAAILAKLAIRPGDIVWDIGAGTGSVSIELALSARSGHVYAVEYRDDACECIRCNRERFRAWNLTVIAGRAPEILSGLPMPDAVFIGGTDGQMLPVLDAVFERNPHVRICVTAVTVETLSQTVDALSARGIGPDITQIGVTQTRTIDVTQSRTIDVTQSRTIDVTQPRTAGKIHLFTAQNPVFLITAGNNDVTAGDNNITAVDNDVTAGDNNVTAGNIGVSQI